MLLIIKIVEIIIRDICGVAGCKLKTKLKDGIILGLQEMDNGNILYFTDDEPFSLFLATMFSS